MNHVDLHYKLALGLNQTYIEKNADYGDAFNKSLDNHGLTAAIVRMEDKMGRFSNLAGRPASMQVEESLEDTLLDLANYAIMTVMWLEQRDKPDTVDLYADGEFYMSIEAAAKKQRESREKFEAKQKLNDMELESGVINAKEYIESNIQESFNECIKQETEKVKNMEPIGGYHKQVGFVPSELIRTDFNKETNMYLVGLGKTTWGAYSLVDQSYIIQTLKEFKNGKLDPSIAWEHIQRFIVKS